MEKWVYLFTEGHKGMRDLLGGKGAGLAEMTRAEIPVPPGFTVSTAACKAYFDAGRCLPEGLWDQVDRALEQIEDTFGKRTARAAVAIAVDMVHEGLIRKTEALQRIAPQEIDKPMLPVFNPESKWAAIANEQRLGTGLNASPGAASGAAALDADTARQWAGEGREVILVRPETTPDDVHGMLPAAGILTQRGGATSHAAVVARGLGKPCGCSTPTTHASATNSAP